MCWASGAIRAAVTTHTSVRAPEAALSTAASVARRAAMSAAGMTAATKARNGNGA